MAKYTPHTSIDKSEMLKEIGVNSIEEIFNIPQNLYADLKLEKGKSELEVEQSLKVLANKNTVFKSIFLGAGAYNHYIPPVVRHLSTREEFVTAYTPYQSEMSQGILQSIFEYQTMIADLTGMDVSNASHYDGATATADGILMCLGRKKRTIISGCMHPEVISVIKTYCEPYDIEVIIAPENNGITDIDALRALMDDSIGAVAISQPNFYGQLEDVDAINEIVKSTNSKFVVNSYPISLGLLKSPAEYGADVVAGEGQPLGMPLSFGGPYLGFLTCKKELMRKMSGRIVGQTVDKNNKTAYVLTLQAREQHIRREKASSSICSNEALCALTAGIFLASYGKEGIKELANQCVSKAHYMAFEIEKLKGFKLKYNGEFFNEFVTTSKKPANIILKALKKANILGGLALNEFDILWCVTEMNTVDDINAVIKILKGVA